MVTLTKPKATETETETQAHEIDESLTGVDDSKEAALTLYELLEELISVQMEPQRESLPLRIAHRISRIYGWLSGPAFTQQDVVRANVAYVENHRRAGTLIV